LSKLAIIGAGYVGLTTAACLADLGNDVAVVDIDEPKVRQLRRHRLHFYEPGLQELVERNARAGRLAFTTSYADAVPGAEFAFIAVATPEGEGGAADVSYVESAAGSIAEAMDGPLVIVNKSTVPIGTGDVVSARVQAAGARHPFDVVSNPEFLREGSALRDFMHPDRVVIGAHDRAAAERVAKLYEPLGAPILIYNLYTAEMVKYASNAFLATRISFINEIARICERVDADARLVAEGMGLDRRIGPDFLDAGIGYGGSCLVGNETVLVRRDGRASLTSLAHLHAEWDGGPFEVLSWRAPERSVGFEAVSSVTRRPFEGELIELSTKLGRRLSCTPDHPFETRDGYKLAGELTTADWLPLAQLREGEGPAVGSFDLLGGLEGAGLQRSDVIVRPAVQVLAAVLPPALRPVLAGARPYDVLRAGAMRLPEMDQLALSLDGAILKTARNGTEVPRRIEADAAFWRVVGLYIAEGHVGSDGRRRRIQWSFDKVGEEDLVEEVRSFWARHGVKADVWHKPTSTAVCVSSRILAGFWLGELGLGKDCYTQRLPDQIWTELVAHKRALLAGMWLGDGSWERMNHGPSVILSYGTASRELADGLLRLLGDLGFAASLRVGRTAKSTCDNYWIRIAGAKQVEQLLDLLPLAVRGVVQSSIARQTKRIAPTGYRRDGDGTAWVRVVGVERRPFAGAVYSLEVPSAHTFVTTGGLVTHNCFPKDVKALAAIAERFNLHPALLTAVMEINRDQRLVAVEKVQECLGTLRGQVVGLLGLSFKPNTDDMREAPSIDIARGLAAKGAHVRAYDPAATERAKVLMPDIEYRTSAYAVARGADALVVVTEWNEFRQLDLHRVKRSMRRPVVIDGRNIYDPQRMRDLGFVYRGIGRN
jgi:UDPglucose 6-dehydrogenase